MNRLDLFISIGLIVYVVVLISVAWYVIRGSFDPAFTVGVLGMLAIFALFWPYLLVMLADWLLRKERYPNSLNKTFNILIM